MKIIVLHGDDTERLYLRLKKFIDVAKKRSYEVNYVDDLEGDFGEILSANSLFGNERFFILKDIKRLNKDKLVWLNKSEDHLLGTLIIYNEGTLSMSNLKVLPKDVKVEEFKLPVLIWSFLDNLVPGNGDRSVRTLHKILEKKPIELVYSLIAKHFRDLYWVKVDAKTAGFPFWKLNKMKSQASKFNEGDLRKIINLLSEGDIKAKTGVSDLISELDLILLKQLE